MYVSEPPTTAQRICDAFRNHCHLARNPYLIWCIHSKDTRWMVGPKPSSGMHGTARHLYFEEELSSSVTGTREACCCNTAIRWHLSLAQRMVSLGLGPGLREWEEQNVGSSIMGWWVILGRVGSHGMNAHGRCAVPGTSTPRLGAWMTASSYCPVGRKSIGAGHG